MLMSSVRDAELASGPINMLRGNIIPGNADPKVLEIKAAGKEEVFCPTVPGDGCFALPNGLAVSNSDGVGYYISSVFPVLKRSNSSSEF